MRRAMIRERDPMHSVTLDEARTDLSRLVARAAEGETILITADGTPMARIVPARPLAGAQPRRVVGFMRGEIAVPDDFDRLGEQDIAGLFGEAR